jgi:BlaI family penicillinase repressor
MTRKPLQSLSPSETEILRLLWSLHSATVQDVCDQLPETREIAYATVQTLLRRLEKKGYVAHESRGKAHVFHPAVRRNEVIRRTVGDFVERLFGGDPAPLMMHLAEECHLNEEEYERLKNIIAQARIKDENETF